MLTWTVETDSGSQTFNGFTAYHTDSGKLSFPELEVKNPENSFLVIIATECRCQVWIVEQNDEVDGLDNLKSYYTSLRSDEVISSAFRIRMGDKTYEPLDW